MFIDYLSIYQNHSKDLPYINETVNVVYSVDTEKALKIFQSVTTFEGSHTTKINILVSDRKVSMWGNPSRLNRLDNLEGFRSLDDCVFVFNKICEFYKLPDFTKNSKKLIIDDGYNVVPDGAIITRIDLTTNKCVGQGNEQTFIAALSSQPFRNQLPYLHNDRNTVDWRTRQLNKISNYIYPSIYNKYAELNIHSTPKIKRKYNYQSDEYKYYFKLLEHIKKCGIVRFETKLKARLLNYLNCQLYGRIDMKILENTHNELLNVPNKLQVAKFDLLTISEQLLVSHLSKTARSANTTAFYAVRWSHGEIFDLSKTQVQHHRCVLRKIGIDISLPCDPSKFTYIKQTSESTIELSDFVIPNFYNKVNRNFTITKTLH